MVDTEARLCLSENRHISGRRGGGVMDMGTIAVIGWTRRNRLHVASVDNSHEADQGHAEHTRRIFDRWQACLTEVASVPWVIGGDWSIEPG